jgi:ParB family chromosome partitioning protein
MTTVDPKAPKRALGRGLDALLPATPPPTASGASYADKSVFTCPVERIAPQKGQPRQHFDETQLEELAASIRENGIIEPIVVRRQAATADRFEIIAGERRWRAAQRAGLKEVLVVVKDVSPKQAFELALVENVQRADLDPIEIAEAYERLVREHGYSQESLADRVGKDRSTVTNALRLLKLPVRIRHLVVSRELSEGHARALLGAPDEKAMNDIADKALRGRLPVRKVEALVRQAKERASGKPGAEKGQAAPGKSSAVRDLEARLMRRLGTKVEVRDKGGSGELAIAYASLDELDRLLALLGA